MTGYASSRGLTHRPMAEIIAALPDEVVRPVLDHPAARAALGIETIEDASLRDALMARGGAALVPTAVGAGNG